MKNAEAIAHTEAAGISCGDRDVAVLPSFGEVAVLWLRVVVAVVEEAVDRHAALVLPAEGLEREDQYGLSLELDVVVVVAAVVGRVAFEIQRVEGCLVGALVVKLFSVLRIVGVQVQ